MSSSYQKILQKIIDTEKRLKPTQQEVSALMDLEINERMGLINQDDNVVEEYKTLKENINAAGMDNYNLAYQPIKVKTRKWSYEDL